MSDSVAVAPTVPGTPAPVDGRRAHGDCLGEATVLALAVGTLPGNERERAVDHLARDPTSADWRSTLADALGGVTNLEYALDRYAAARATNARERALRAELVAAEPTDSYGQAALARAEYRLGLIELVEEHAAAAAAAFARAAALARPLAATQAAVANDLCEDLDALAEAEGMRRGYPAALAALDEGLAVARDWDQRAPAPAWAGYQVTLRMSRARIGKAMGAPAQALDDLRTARAAAIAAPAGAVDDDLRADLDAELAALDRAAPRPR